MIVEHEVGGFGVGLLGFPVAVGDLAQGEGAVVRRAVGGAAVALVPVIVPVAAGGGQGEKGKA